MALHFAGGSKKKTTKKTKKQSNKTSDKTSNVFFFSSMSISNIVVIDDTPSLYKRQKVSVDTLVSRTWVRPLDPFDSRKYAYIFIDFC